MEKFLEKVAWPEAQLPLGRSPEVVPSSPVPARTEPRPAEPQPLVVDPPASPEVEILSPPLAPPAPPLIIILDDSADEAASPPDSPSCYLEDGINETLGLIRILVMDLKRANKAVLTLCLFRFGPEYCNRAQLIRQALEKAVFTFSLSQSVGLASIR
ncbi:hypothetical protein GmHk_U059405 [Glycine max]|nr:hypothetical protein GmHk_U059405 [Glycine max]